MTVHTHFHFFLLHLSTVSGILNLFRGFPCLDLAFCLSFWPCVLSCKWPDHKSHKSHCSTQHMLLWLAFSHAGQSSRLPHRCGAAAVFCLSMIALPHICGHQQRAVTIYPISGKLVDPCCSRHFHLLLSNVPAI